jgi:hypothetical protein
MLRNEEPSSDFVRLLVRTVVLPEPHSSASSYTTFPPPANTNVSPNSPDSSPEAKATGDREASQDNVETHPGSTSSTSTMQDTQAEMLSEQRQAVAGAPALSPDAVASLLSPASGCEVLLQEESRWLVVSETFSPGDICR